MVGATSKWQSDGRNTLLAHGKTIDDGEMPIGARWGVGGAIAQRFAQEGFFVALTTRKETNAAPLAEAIRSQNGECMIVELDLVSQDSISTAFAKIRKEAGDPEVLVYNAGYLEGRDLPPDKELLEYIPLETFDTAQHISSRGPFLVAKEVLPAMRQKGSRIIFDQQQREFAARAQADDRAITLLSARYDAYPRSGPHRRIFRARRTRRQRDYRRPDRFTGNARAVDSSKAPRNRDESREDRGSVLLPAHPGQVVLDSRPPANALSYQTEFLAMEDRLWL